jgi:hypothetical protein
VAGIGALKFPSPRMIRQSAKTNRSAERFLPSDEKASPIETV